MWAQLITTRVKPGREGELRKLADELRATEQADSGLVRSTMLQDQKDPSRIYMFVVFDSEEAARAREDDPRRRQGLDRARAIMTDIFEGAPEFVDLTVLEELMP